MSQNNTVQIDYTARSNWIKLKTLINVRWFAIAGQVIALIFAQEFYFVSLPIVPCIVAIGISVLGNIFALIVYPYNSRLTRIGTMSMLMFDIFQLCFLLALTGGLHNPFALLVIAPVTIAATVLPARLAALLAAVAICMISLVGIFYLPLLTADGNILKMPETFVFGFWISIIVGITFTATYTRRVASELSSMSEALLATQMALAREQKLTDLGGVVAATAHELGTPLATIKLVSAEMMDDLKDQEDLYEDAALIREQADRCRDILHSMGRAGKNDAHLRTAPLLAVLEEAAEPHLNRGKAVIFNTITDNSPFPVVFRKPEIIHGLRNLIQNAVDFSNETVFVDMEWTISQIKICIVDDGPGYSPHVLNRIGDPFVNKRTTSATHERPGYEGMGLGLFIAKTLLERSGAKMDFTNGLMPPEKTGAKITLKWHRDDLEAPSKTNLGENKLFDTMD